MSHLTIKRLIFLATIAASILAFRMIDNPAEIDLERHWSYADPICFVIGIYCLVKILSGSWRIDSAAFYMFAFLCVTAFSGLINDALYDGTFLTFARTLTWGLVFYLTVSNLIESDADYQFALGAICLLGAAATLYALSVLREEWAATFTHLVDEKFANLNLFAFCETLLLGPSLVWWVAKPKSLIRIGSLGVIVAAIAVGFSRAAYTCTFILLILTLFTNLRMVKNWRVLAAFMVSIALLLYVHTQFIGWSGEAAEFWQIKEETYTADLWGGRVIANLWEPIVEWSEQPLFQLLFGDAVSVKHSILAATLWVSGIVGTFLFVMFHIQLITMARKQWILAGKLGVSGINPGSVFLATTFIMVLNDMLTTGRVWALYLALVFGIITGLYAGYLKTMEFRFRSTVDSQPDLLAATYQERQIGF